MRIQSVSQTKSSSSPCPTGPTYLNVKDRAPSEMHCTADCTLGDTFSIPHHIHRVLKINFIQIDRIMPLPFNAITTGCQPVSTLERMERLHLRFGGKLGHRMNSVQPVSVAVPTYLHISSARIFCTQTAFEIVFTTGWISPDDDVACPNFPRLTTFVATPYSSVIVVVVVGGVVSAIQHFPFNLGSNMERASREEELILLVQFRFKSLLEMKTNTESCQAV